MTAAYGLPDRLFPAIARGVEIAASVIQPGDGHHLGRSLVEWADEWEEKCRINGRHRDLLKPAEAASLLAVIVVAVEYIDACNYVADEDEGTEDFLQDVAFALASEEVLYTLGDIANSARLVAV